MRTSNKSKNVVLHGAECWKTNCWIWSVFLICWLLWGLLFCNIFSAITHCDPLWLFCDPVNPERTKLKTWEKPLLNGKIKKSNLLCYFFLDKNICRIMTLEQNRESKTGLNECLSYFVNFLLRKTHSLGFWQDIFRF